MKVVFSFPRDNLPENKGKDECQFLARPDVAEQVGALFAESIRLAGEHFGFACPTTGEFKIGPSWAETH